MNVLLINPVWQIREGNIWKKITGYMPPLGLSYVAGYLEKNGVNVSVIDAQAEHLPFSALVESVKETPDFVGITTATVTSANALEIAAACRQLYPAAKIVFGGVHPTIMPGDMLKSPYVDYVIRGEGEKSFLALVNGGKDGEISGLSYKKNGAFVHNPESPLIQDLDSLPFPAYHLLPMKLYRPTLGSYKRLPAVSIITTRGCPGKCTFCLGSYLGGKVRMHSIKYIVDEIQMLQKDFGIKELLFYDDTFTVYRHKVLEFCREITARKTDLSWVCFARVDFVDEEVLRAMKKAGCHQIMYGIESGSEVILANIKKKTSLSRARDIIRLTKKTGIETRAAFMLGSPGETDGTIKQTFDFAKELDPDIALFNVTTPYPGTEMYKWADSNGYLISKDWSKYDYSTAVMELPTLSAAKIAEYYRKAHKDFYGRPLYLLKRLLKIRSFAEAWVAFKAFLAIFKK